MIYVYAVTDQPEAPLPSQLGQQDEVLAKVTWRDVVAVVSSFNGSQLSKTGDELWRHEEVVEALMSDRAVVPLRFGTLLPSPQRVSDLLGRANGALVRDLERVRGQVEIGVRFLTAVGDVGEQGTPTARLGEGATADSQSGNAPAAASDDLALSRNGPGAAYLLERLVRQRALRDRHRARLTPVREAFELLARHASASTLDDEPDDRRGTSAAFLVPRDRIACFRELVDATANVHPELALLCTGPWPPYSFVNAGERAANCMEARYAG